MLNTLEDLFKLARERKNNPVEGSYTNKLLNDKNLSKEKILEEIHELIEAVEKNSNKIHEAADVLYHLVIYLEANEINSIFFSCRSFILLFILLNLSSAEFSSSESSSLLFFVLPQHKYYIKNRTCVSCS